MAILLALLGLAACAEATVTVNATLTDGQGNPLQFAFLKLHLNYCGYNVPQVGGGSFSIVGKDLILTPAQLPASIYANNEITCGNSYSTLWHVTAFLDSSTPIAGDRDYDLCSTTSNCAAGIATLAWNLNGATPFNLGPLSPPPPGFQTIFGNPSGPQVITQPGGGSGAAVTTTVLAGAVNGCSVTVGGSGYLSPPALELIGAGTGAVLYATTAAGVMTGCSVAVGGSGYLSPPAVNVVAGTSLAIVGILDLSHTSVIPSSNNAPIQNGNIVAGSIVAQKIEGIEYADQFLNAINTDIGLAAVAACNALPVGGGTVYIAAGIYSFSHTITNCGKNVIFQGAAAGTPSFPASPNQLIGTDLIYTGTGTPFSISGNAVQAWIRDLAIDNTGTGTVAIDFDGGLNHYGISNVSINPQGSGAGEICFSVAAVRAGNTGNVVDGLIEKSYLRCDQPANAPPGLLLLGVNAGFTVRDTHFTGGGLVLGSLTQNVFGFHCVGCAFDMESGGGTGTTTDDAIEVLNAYEWDVDDSEFELGQATTNPTTGYAVNCPTTATRCTSGSVNHSTIGGPYSANTTYAFNLNNAASTFSAVGNYFYSFANPAYVLRDQNTVYASLRNNILNSTGMVLTSSGAGSVVCMDHNFYVVTASWLGEFNCAPAVTFGGVITPGVFAFASLPAAPASGTMASCSDCQVTTAASCSTATPASCVCKAGGNGSVAKFENFQGNGANWYCQ